MATLATIISRIFTPGAGEAVARPAENPEDLYLVRAIPNDDVCLFVKDIDNTRVVRKVDQVAPKRCLKTIAGFCGAAALLILLLLPGAYSLLAGYEIQNLREKRQQLLIERAGLELEEARLTSPERLEELAKVQDFIDPAPDKIIYLPPTQGSLALNLPQQ